MPEARASGVPRSRTIDLALVIGVWIALFAAMMPLLRVVDAGPWVGGAFALTGAVLAAGYAARCLRLPAILVSVIEIIVWVALVTAAFGRGTGFLWIIPTPETFTLADVLVRSAIEDVALGAAPLEAGPALSFLIVAAIGLLAVALDHVVLTARMPLLAAVGLVAVSLIPSIAVPGDVDIVAFAALAVSILFLLAVDTRARQRAAGARAEGVGLDGAGGPRPSRGRSARVAPGTAIGIGAVAVVVAMVASPLLPAPDARAGPVGGNSGGATIDPSLELGDDLRQPGAVEVLQVRTTGTGAPYLRVATLSQFDGAVWDPDEGESRDLEPEASELDPVAVGEGVAVTEDRATIDVVELNGRFAPVPYPATDVSGLDGTWSILADNRTVEAESGSVREQSYDVVAAVPDPTLEQVRATSAGGIDDDDVYALPGDIPSVIARTADEITADSRTDYDALVALQSWFRGTDFRYSLDAPVSDGFDGTGVEAIAEFLDVRQGYCVHFASAFAVMARTLGMPARIVVGYLPGSSTGSQTDGETVYSVQSTQLHAWPEVHFDGIGWVPFEPTNSLGTPTNFASGSTTTPGTTPSSAPQTQEPTPTPTPTSSAGLTPLDEQDGAASNGGGSTASVNLWPLGLTLAALVALALPGAVREIRRRRLLAAAGRGDAPAAWLSIQELAVDLGIPAPAAESPRAFGARLVRHHGADPSATDVLVAAIERVSYAGDRAAVAREEWADAVSSASTSLLGAASPGRRFVARVAPRSLAVRPGSTYASRRARPARESTA
ncbi:DUF3488 and DUF4129 domain-containing transglutaminase family protein [Microbacterium sp. P06]|uniref:transglutaminase TgpA family protein n=1 Tax=unclassified Microbacterium TaxID=2609290 RepID=UPI003744E487